MYRLCSVLGYLSCCSNQGEEKLSEQTFDKNSTQAAKNHEAKLTIRKYSGPQKPS